MSVGAQYGTAFVDTPADRTRHAGARAACQNDAKRGRRKAEDLGAINHWRWPSSILSFASKILFEPWIVTGRLGVSGLVFAFDRGRLCRGTPGSCSWPTEYSRLRVWRARNLRAPRWAYAADDRRPRGCRLLFGREERACVWMNSARSAEAVHHPVDQRLVSPDLPKSLRVMPDQFRLFLGLRSSAESVYPRSTSSSSGQRAGVS